MANPLLLMAYAFSTKIKSDREKTQAIAAQKAKTAITNYVNGPAGIKPVTENYTAKKGEKLYGFTIGTSGTMNKFPEEELPLIDLYENPTKKGSLITKNQYNAMATGYSSVDKADSTTTTKPPLGMVVAQRSPADNKLVYMDGYKPFDIQKTKETVPVVLVKGKPVKAKENQTATHTVTMENGKITSAPVKIDVDKQEITTVEEGVRVNGKFTTTIPEGQKATHQRTIKKINGNIVSTGTASLITEKPKDEILKEYEYYDNEGKPTKNPTEIVSQRPFKEIDGVKKFVGKLEEYKPKEGEKTKITFLYDKDGKETTDKSKAVQQQTKTFDYDGGLVEESDLKDVKRFEPKAEDVNLAKTEYLIQDVNNPRDQKFVSEKEALEKQLAETHNIIGYKNYNDKGVAGDLKDYSQTDKKNSVENALRSKDIVGTIRFATDEKDKNLKTVYKGVSFFRNQSGQQNLSGLNIFFSKNPEFITTANTDKATEQQLRTLIIPALRSYFTGEVKSGDKVHFTRTMPKTPSRAYRLAGSEFLELSKLNNFRQYTLLASDLADEKIMKDLIESAEIGETNIVVKSNVIQNNKVSGTVYAAVGVPEQYKSTIEKMSGYIGDVRDKDSVGALIEKLIIYETDDKGMLKKRDDGDGMYSNVPSQNQPPLDFIETLMKTSLGKTVKGRPATMFDAFLALIHPFPDAHPVGEINPQVQEEILTKFASLAQYDFKKAMNLISSFTAKNSTATNILMEQFYGENYSVEKVKSDLRGKSTSAYNGIVTIDAMLQTYFTDDGGDIDINTAQGEVVLTAAGVSKFVRKGAKVLSTMFKGGDAIDVLAENSNTVADSFVDQNDIYDSVDPDDEKEISARQRNQQKLEDIKSLMNGTGDVSSLVKKIDSRTRRMLNTDKGEEILRKLAVRQYHKYMLAYQLAAAIQGGTGGRTISDQDVENIMRSLNFGFFTTADKEQATLGAARKMLVDLYEYNEALLNPNPSIQFAGYKAQQFLIGRKRGALLSNVADRRNFILTGMANASGATFKREGTDEKTGVTDYGIQKQKELEKFIKRND